MTGFGRSKIDTTNMSITVELKSVNHRFREYYFRMPRQLMKLEEKIKKEMNSYVSRGRVEVFITLTGEGALKHSVVTDWELLDEFHQTLEKMQKRFNLKGEITINDLLQREELIQIEESEDGNTSLEALILSAVKQAAKQLHDMRLMEGNSLKNDITGHMEKLAQHLNDLFTYAPTVAKQYTERLRHKLTEAAQNQIDETRLLTEIMLFADKSDISEELTRLQSHLKQFLHTVELSEPVGRKLDFLLQEMNREVNTIGSKANDVDISREVVEMKSLLEKVKEQIQNIE